MPGGLPCIFRHAGPAVSYQKSHSRDREIVLTLDSGALAERTAAACAGGSLLGKPKKTFGPFSAHR